MPQIGNHIPTGNLNCSASGCHTTKNVNPGGFKLDAASITSPTPTAAAPIAHATRSPFGANQCGIFGWLSELLGSPIVRGNVKRTLEQLKRAVEHEHLRSLVTASASQCYR